MASANLEEVKRRVEDRREAETPSMTFDRAREIENADAAGTFIELEPGEREAYDEAKKLISQQAKEMGQILSGITAQITSVIMPLPGVDFSSLLHNFSDLSGIMKPLFTGFQDFPENWSDVDASYGDILNFMDTFKVPLAFAPRASVVDQLLTADSLEQCANTLLEFRSEILEDCLLELTKIDSSTIGFDTSLAESAVHALKDGHLEAGAALALLVIDTALGLIPQTGTRTQYAKVKDGFGVRYPETSSVLLAPAWAAFHPIQNLYRPWNRPSERLEGASRHQAVHYAVPDSYQPQDCLVMAMSLVSILRGLTKYPDALYEAWKASNSQDSIRAKARSSKAATR